MSDTLVSTREPRQAAAAGRLPRLAGMAAVLLPWLVAAGSIWWALVSTGVENIDIVRYVVYVALGLALPGTLVLRSLVGQRRTLTEDVTLGILLGCGLELAALALTSVLGVQPWLRLWPVAVVLLFALVPGLRRHWRPAGAGADRLPALWHWGVLAPAALAAVRMVRELGIYRLPPGQGAYYQDLLWHLGIIHSLNRSFPPEVPQVAGETLRYHWLSHAQMAAAHLVSGAPEATLLLRLWPAAMAVLAVFAAATLARELSGIWWSGPLAGWLIALLHGIQILPVGAAQWALHPLSPSQSYVAPMALGVGILSVRAMRGERLGRGWIALVVMAAVAAGSKPTALPMLVAGALLAALVSGIFRRPSWKPALGVAAIGALIFPVSSRLLSGSDSGSSISLFDFVEWFPLYHYLTGEPRQPVVGPMLPEGVADLSPRSLQILALLLLAVIVPHAALIGSLVAVRFRSVRHDAAMWFMVGTIGSGFAVYLMLSHPALSQAYFAHLAVGFAAPVMAWVTAAAVERVPVSPSKRTAIFVTGVALGVVVALIARYLTPTTGGARLRSLEAWRLAYAVPLGIAIAAIVVGAIAVLAARRFGRWPLHAGVAVLAAAAVIGAPLVTDVRPALAPVKDLVLGEPLEQGGGLRLAPGAGEALHYLNTHAPEDAVVATNRHCSHGIQRPRCSSLAFFVSGLGGRQTVLEGWAYAGHAGGYQLDSPWPQRLADNDAMFTKPSAELIERMKRQFNVSWLVADSSAGKVSPALTEFATPRFHEGTVTIYELKN